MCIRDRSKDAADPVMDAGGHRFASLVRHSPGLLGLSVATAVLSACLLYTSVMQCCESLSNAIAAAAIGGLGQALGYRDAFALAWAVALVALLLIGLGLRRLEVAR